MLFHRNKLWVKQPKEEEVYEDIILSCLHYSWEDCVIKNNRRSGFVTTLSSIIINANTTKNNANHIISCCNSSCCYSKLPINHLEITYTCTITTSSYVISNSALIIIIAYSTIISCFWISTIKHLIICLN